MGAVLELEDRFIRNTYLLTFCLIISIVVEALLKGESSAFPGFLIASAIGFSLFWSIELIARKVVLSDKTELTKRLLGIIVFPRYTVLGVLLYFLLYFLLASTDIVFALITCVTICGTFFAGNWLAEKTGNIKELEMFTLASIGVIIVLAFCIGYFMGRWIGGYFGNAEVGGAIGLVFGFAAAIVQGFRVQKQRRDAAQQA
ncbi:MAG: AtpZ/AtpI family protein [Candidatus Poribacteria bacterium]|nr:AtpZ/AtpI family protein [Candidatus Poribacteria bacterium]